MGEKLLRVRENQPELEHNYAGLASCCIVGLTGRRGLVVTLVMPFGQISCHRFDSLCQPGVNSACLKSR